MNRDEEACYYMFCTGTVVTIVGIILAVCLEFNAYVNKSRPTIVRNAVVSLLGAGTGFMITGAVFGMLEAHKSEMEINAQLQRLPSKKKDCPKMCEGCKYYYGQCGVNCALHPYGNDTFCKDYAEEND